MDTSVERQLQIYKRNLERMQRQLESYGNNDYIPPKLLNDIEDHKNKIKELENMRS